MCYGSEFRLVFLLENLFFLRDDKWLRDNIKAIENRNHKSTLSHLDMLRSNVEKEIKLGYQFVFDKSIINNIPNSVVPPMG